MADDNQEPVLESNQEPEAPAPEQEAPAQSQAEINREIARLTRSEAETKQINAALLAAIQAEAQSRQQAQPPPESREDGPPQRGDFQDDYAFFEARQNYLLKQAEANIDNLVDRKIQDKRARFEQEERDRRLRESYNKGLSKHPDFDVVVQESATVISNPMVAMMSEYEDPEEIYYKIASDKREAARIAGLSPARQAFEIGKIADAIKAKASSSEPMEPMKPLSGGSAPSPSLYDTTSPSSDRLSDAEWIRREEERVRKRMGGR